MKTLSCRLSTIFPRGMTLSLKPLRKIWIKSCLIRLQSRAVRERVRARFQILTKRNDKGNLPNIKQEVALTVSQKKLKSRYQLCGRFGHKKVDCYNNDIESNNSFSSFGLSKSNNSNSKSAKDLFCNYCKKRTHRSILFCQEEKGQGKSTRGPPWCCFDYYKFYQWDCILHWHQHLDNRFLSNFSCY
jgi:hypothetical protein